MQTYAVLGATGQTGTELVKYLMLDPEVRLKLYARSEEKLHAVHKNLGSTSAQVFSGAITNVNMLADCICDTNVVFATVAQNQNDPSCNISRQTARSLIAALNLLRNRSDDFQCPKVIFLSSATFNPIFKKEFPRLGTWFLYQALWYVYEDLRMAIDLLEHEAWIPLVLACPGGLVHAPPTPGVGISPLHNAQLCGYADLAKGMVLMARDEEALAYRRMGVTLQGQVKGNPAALLRWLLPGILCSWATPLWRLGKTCGLW